MDDEIRRLSKRAGDGDLSAALRLVELLERTAQGREAPSVRKIPRPPTHPLLRGKVRPSMGRFVVEVMGFDTGESARAGGRRFASIDARVLKVVSRMVGPANRDAYLREGASPLITYPLDQVGNYGERGILEWLTVALWLRPEEVDVPTDAPAYAARVGISLVEAHRILARSDRDTLTGAIVLLDFVPMLTMRGQAFIGVRPRERITREQADALPTFDENITRAVAPVRPRVIPGVACYRCGDAWQNHIARREDHRLICANGLDVQVMLFDRQRAVAVLERCDDLPPCSQDACRDAVRILEACPQP